MEIPGLTRDSKDTRAQTARRATAGSRSRALIIFAALPRPGEVKKRLAREIGVQPAAALYNDLATHTFRVGHEAAARGWMVFLFHSPNVNVKDMRQWVARDFHFVAQRGENPGARIQHAFDYVFHHRTAKAVVISSDIPGMDYAILEEASDRLDRYDIVIGPAKDGGCYLIGMKPPTKGIFRDLPWGTATVFREASERVHRLGLSQSILAQLADVDTAEEYRKYFMRKMRG